MKTKHPFRSGSNKSTGMRTKKSFEFFKKKKKAEA